MLKRRRNARCTAVADLVLMNSPTQKILCCIVAILLSTDAAARLCARRALQRWYLKIQDLLFRMLCRPFTYHVYFRKYRRTKLSPSFESRCIREIKINGIRTNMRQLRLYRLLPSSTAVTLCATISNIIECVRRALTVLCITVTMNSHYVHKYLHYLYIDQ